jgi:hypothetical protein
MTANSYCARDYAMEKSPTRAQHCSRQPHLVKCLQEEDVSLS